MKRRAFIALIGSAAACPLVARAHRQPVIAQLSRLRAIEARQPKPEIAALARAPATASMV